MLRRNWTIWDCFHTKLSCLAATDGARRASLNIQRVFLPHFQVCHSAALRTDLRSSLDKLVAFVASLPIIWYDFNVWLLAPCPRKCTEAVEPLGNGATFHCDIENILRHDGCIDQYNGDKSGTQQRWPLISQCTIPEHIFFVISFSFINKRLRDW